jgi:hypothetical protein
MSRDRTETLAPKVVSNQPNRRHSFGQLLLVPVDIDGECYGQAILARLYDGCLARSKRLTTSGQVVQESGVPIMVTLTRVLLC